MGLSGRIPATLGGQPRLVASWGRKGSSTSSRCHQPQGPEAHLRSTFLRFLTYQLGSTRGLAAAVDGTAFGILEGDPGYPGDLHTLIAGGTPALTAAFDQLRRGAAVDLAKVTLLPPVLGSSKILCVGQNYREHATEMGNTVPSYPLIFARFASSLIGHGSPMIRPHASIELDYEGELVAVIGRRARHVGKDAALDYVAGYSIFNDG